MFPMCSSASASARARRPRGTVPAHSTRGRAANTTSPRHTARARGDRAPWHAAGLGPSEDIAAHQWRIERDRTRRAPDLEFLVWHVGEQAKLRGHVAFDAALALVAEAPKTFVIGGGELYALALPRADEPLTVVPAAP